MSEFVMFPVPNIIFEKKEEKEDRKIISPLGCFAPILTMSTPIQRESAILATMAEELQQKNIVVEQQAQQLREAASRFEFDIFEVEYWRAVAEKQQQKFMALYAHCLVITVLSWDHAARPQLSCTGVHSYGLVPAYPLLDPSKQIKLVQITIN